LGVEAPKIIILVVQRLSFDAQATQAFQKGKKTDSKTMADGSRKRKSRWGDVGDSQESSSSFIMAPMVSNVPQAPSAPQTPHATYLPPAPSGALPPPKHIPGVRRAGPPNIATLITALEAKSSGGNMITLGGKSVTNPINASLSRAVANAPVGTSLQPPGAIQNPGNRLYIGSVPLDITQAQIEALFSPFGHVLKVDWSQHDTIPSLSKGYCFVWFSDPGTS